METKAVYEIDIEDIRQVLQRKVKMVIPHLSVISEANVMQHWTKRRKRRIVQDSIIRTFWRMEKYHNTVECNKPYVIILTRMSPRRLDGDNLQVAFKSIRDTIADILIPGKKRGVSDSAPGLTWIYDQEKGSKGIKIEIYAKD